MQKELEGEDDDEESKAQILLPEVQLEPRDESPDAHRMSMKLFKMIFNRALRIKSRNTPSGECMFRYLDKKLEQMLGTQNTYYQAGICLELVRTENRQDRFDGARMQLDRARSILKQHFGGDQSPSYLDYVLRKVEFLVNVVLDAYAGNTKYATTDEELEALKNELKETNEAYIALAVKTNRPAADASANKTTKSGLITSVGAEDVGSEFVLESLLMKL